MSAMEKVAKALGIKPDRRFKYGKVCKNFEWDGELFEKYGFKMGCVAYGITSYFHNAGSAIIDTWGGRYLADDTAMFNYRFGENYAG